MKEERKNEQSQAIKTRASQAVIHLEKFTTSYKVEHKYEMEREIFTFQT